MRLLDAPGLGRSALTLAARVLYREALLSRDAEDKEGLETAAGWCVYAATLLADRERTPGEA